MGTLQATNSHPWSVTASLGYTNYQSMYSDDGQTALGRLAIGKELFTRKYLIFGLEIGVQSGNTMRLNVPQITLDEIGGLPNQSTVKPTLDLLATAKIQPLGSSQFFGEIKGGIAYRQWQADSSRDAPKRYYVSLSKRCFDRCMQRNRGLHHQSI
jgi:hypothetical protein